MMRKMLILTTDFDHPLIARVHYLFDFLKMKRIEVKIVNIPFESEKQSITKYLKKMLASAKTTYSSSTTDTLVRFPKRSRVLGGTLSSVGVGLSYAIALFLSGFFLRKYAHRIVIAIGPFAGLPAILFLKKKSFIVYENTDFWTDTSKGLLQKKAVSLIERLCLRKAHLVISNSSLLNEMAKSLNPSSVLIQNGVNTRFYSYCSGLPRDPSITYMGSIAKWAGLDLALEAMPRLLERFPQLKLRVSGDGPDKARLERLVKDNQLEKNVFFLGKLPYEELPKLLRSSSIGIAVFKPDNFTAYASPLKLYEYMAAGLPIVATDIGETSKVMKESQAGLCIDWTPDGFVDAVTRLITNEELWKDCSTNGLNYAHEFDWNVLFERWLSYVESHLRNYEESHENKG